MIVVMQTTMTTKTMIATPEPTTTKIATTNIPTKDDGYRDVNVIFVVHDDEWF